MTQSSVPFGSRTRAVLLLLFLSGVVVAGLYSSRASSPPRSVPVRDRRRRGHVYGDGAAAVGWRAVYYDVVGGELRQRGYATRPFFNWRTPLLFSAVALAPRVARVVLISLGLILLVATITHFAAEPSLVAVASLVAQIGALPITLVPGSVVLHEAWTGVFIGLSVWLYLRGSWRLAALVGLACIVRAGSLRLHIASWRLCLLFASAGGRRFGCGWSAAYCTRCIWDYMSRPCWRTASQAISSTSNPGSVRRSAIPISPRSFGTAGWLLRPTWVALGPLVVLLAGVFDRRLNPHLRFAVAAYLAFFCVAGHDFNDYWGAVPLLTYPLLFGYALRSSVDLTRTAFGKFQAE